MDEEERRLNTMSAAEFDRETEEILENTDVTPHNDVSKANLSKDCEDVTLNSNDCGSDKDTDTEKDKDVSKIVDDIDNLKEVDENKSTTTQSNTEDDKMDEDQVHSTTSELDERTENNDDNEQKDDNVEETMKALQSDEVTNSHENDNDKKRTEFVQVNSKTDKNSTPSENSQDSGVDGTGSGSGNGGNDEDPIGGTGTESCGEYDDNNSEKDGSRSQKLSKVNTDNEESMSSSKGADEELCIIPDTERVISQEEKDAATAQQKSNKDDNNSESNNDSGSKLLNKSGCENGDDTSQISTELSDSNTGIDAQSSKSDHKKDDWAVSNDSSKSPTTDTTADENNYVVSKDDFDESCELTKLDKEVDKVCKQCSSDSCWYLVYNKDSKDFYFCRAVCYDQFLNGLPEKSAIMPKQSVANKFKVSRDKTREPLVYVRMCSDCKQTVTNDDRNLSWECMEFCNEDCLTKYQSSIGGFCANCKDKVPLPSLGKYCVRFGYDIRQFCSSGCLEDFKKGLKVCSYCQKDISGTVEGFLAPVGDKGQFKDFCSQSCMQKYDQMSNNYAPKRQTAECDVCSNEKLIRLEIEVEGVVHKLCSEPCFVAFKFANNVSPEQCHMCQKYFEQTTLDYTIYFDDQPHHFCCKTCQNVYIIANRKIVPCQWCKVKKYNFDMIKKSGSVGGQSLMMCSINCLALYQVSINAVSSRKTKCDQCAEMNQAKYHLTMSDASIRNFCSYPCVMNFQNQFSKSPITIASTAISANIVIDKTSTRSSSNSSGGVGSGSSTSNTLVQNNSTKRSYSARQTRSSATSNDSKQIKLTQPPPSTSPQLPIITSVHSLAQPQTNGPSTVTRSSTKSGVMSAQLASSPSPPATQIQAVQTQATLGSQQSIISSKPKFVQQIIVKPPPVPEVKNKSTMCKPNMHTKGVSFKPHMATKDNQTDESLAKTVIIPVPVPIYVPSPMSLFSVPFPVPVPFPLPVPIPIFIPTTRNSANGIMKEIKKIQVKIPTDPFEAELLMMAEMVAGDKKVDNTDSESEDDDNGGNEGGFSPEAVDTSNTFGDDMLQMALKMATELDEPAVDLEGALTANTITASQSHDGGEEDEENQQMHHHAMMEARGGGRGRKRQARQPRTGNTASKRGRRMSGHDMPMMPPPQAAAPPPPPEPVEKPDANMCLKYTFGVNAWKQWVTTKNAELEKSTLPLKPFKSEILQLTADELNYSLCLFVKEVRKPNGSEYAPDTIYYLCLGIQQYLFENGRIDNIFTDAFYEKFTDCLDEVARKFSVLYNDSHYIVTRVEEEHLWESKQLGAHSPHVLLSTLMFFNTKHFNLTTVDEHMQLSFSHIMKHWKRNPNQPGASKGPGSRNVLLRFYPPQSALGDSADANARKKKVYEQQENEENPLRCPVKLYEFYLSKCPESVKTRNDVFYLLPERSCVPDSPVWYSTMALGRNALEKMLHRVKMVKEINVALLTS